MQRYYQQGYTTFKFKKIEHKTAKAILFEISHGIKIWVPKSAIKKLTNTSFKVTDQKATDIKLSIRAEKQALNK